MNGDSSPHESVKEVKRDPEALLEISNELLQDLLAFFFSEGNVVPLRFKDKSFPEKKTLARVVKGLPSDIKVVAVSGLQDYGRTTFVLSHPDFEITRDSDQRIHIQLETINRAVEPLKDELGAYTD